MSAGWQLAQLNIAKAKYPLDDPRMHGFVSQIDAVNALAERSPGFVWRLKTDTGNAADIEVGDDPLLVVNMSVWSSVEALSDFAYKSAHRLVVANRKTWFEKPDQAYQVLWWVPAGHRPTTDQGFERLEALRKSGPSPAAFTFAARFPAPGADRSEAAGP
ncbi:MAG: DUF3291 domain-containing protein [Gammaproteobacteria bacterium]|nr:DUF3291 domain-containing protein [Gammaproteobacteria bacterium]